MMTVVIILKQPSKLIILFERIKFWYYWQKDVANLSDNFEIATNMLITLILKTQMICFMVCYMIILILIDFLDCR